MGQLVFSTSKTVRGGMAASFRQHQPGFQAAIDAFNARNRACHDQQQARDTK
jgi:hypothetical protein